MYRKHKKKKWNELCHIPNWFRVLLEFVIDWISSFGRGNNAVSAHRLSDGTVKKPIQVRNSNSAEKKKKKKIVSAIGTGCVSANE